MSNDWTEAELVRAWQPRQADNPPDVIDRLFGEEPIEEEEEFYPGSKRKRREPPTVEFMPEKWQDNFVVKWLKGVETRLYPVGALATAVGASVSSVRRWSTMGHIPQAPYRLASNMIIGNQKVAGRRYYTAEMIEAVVEVFGKYGLLGKPRILWDLYPEVPTEIHNKWTALQQRTN